MQAGSPTLAAANAFAITDCRPDLLHVTMPTQAIRSTDDKTVPIDSTAHEMRAQLIEDTGNAHGLFAICTRQPIDDLPAPLVGKDVGRDTRPLI